MGKKSNKGLIVTIVILLLLLVGVSGYLVYDKEFTKEDVKKNNQAEEKQDNNKTNTENDGFEIYNVGKGFKALEDVAEIVTTGYTLQYDLDNDGKKENIDVLIDEEYHLVEGLSINEKKVSDDALAGELCRLYVVDLNQNDDILNIVIEVHNMDFTTRYYLVEHSKNGIVHYIGSGVDNGQGNILIDGNGKIVSIGYFGKATTPMFSPDYLEYDGNINVKKVDLSNVDNMEFVISKDSGLYYTFEDDFDKLYEKFFAGMRGEENGIYEFEKDTKIKVIKYGEREIKAKLENGKFIYVFIHFGA